jgi:signal transduction histidine kinase
MVGAMVDVTLLKRGEVELHRLHEELEARVLERTQAVAEANEALEAFTYSVSHDLRAPLRHIKGFVQLLARNNMERLDDDGRRYLSVILSAADKMSELIEALLSFSRISKGELQRVPVDLSLVVAEAVQNLESEVRGREIRWNVHPLCGEGRSCSDAVGGG